MIIMFGVLIENKLTIFTFASLFNARLVTLIWVNVCYSSVFQISATTSYTDLISDEGSFSHRMRLYQSLVVFIDEKNQAIHESLIDAS